MQEKMLRQYLQIIVPLWKELDVSPLEASYAYHQLQYHFSQFSTYVGLLKKAVSIQRRYLSAKNRLSRLKIELREHLHVELISDQLSVALCKSTINYLETLNEMACLMTEGRDIAKHPVQLPGFIYSNKSFFSDEYQKNVFSENIKRLLYLTGFCTRETADKQVDLWIALGTSSGRQLHQLKMLLLLGQDVNQSMPQTCYQLPGLFRRHLEKQSRPLSFDWQNLYQFLNAEESLMLKFSSTIVTLKRKGVKVSLWGDVPLLFRFSHVPEYTIDPCEYDRQMLRSQIESSRQELRAVTLFNSRCRYDDVNRINRPISSLLSYNSVRTVRWLKETCQAANYSFYCANPQPQYQGNQISQFGGIALRATATRYPRSVSTQRSIRTLHSQQLDTQSSQISVLSDDEPQASPFLSAPNYTNRNPSRVSTPCLTSCGAFLVQSENQKNTRQAKQSDLRSQSTLSPTDIDAPTIDVKQQPSHNDDFD